MFDSCLFFTFFEKSSSNIWSVLKKAVTLHSLSEREANNEIFDRLRTEEIETSSLNIVTI